MLESKGLKAPTFLKTGTTIVGLVFQVWNPPLFYLVSYYCYDVFLRRGGLYFCWGLLVLYKGLCSLFVCFFIYREFVTEIASGFP